MFIDGVKYNKQLCIYAVLHSEERMLMIGVSDLVCSAVNVINSM